MNTAFSDSLAQLFSKNLQQLSEEISQYEGKPLEFWAVRGMISNSAGHLTQHILGNLNHFIGHVLAKTDYVRDRKAEFSTHDISIATFKEQIEAVDALIQDTFSKMTEEEWAQTYPLEVFKKPITTAYFMQHLLAHLSYHMGQINYHRRLIQL
ncbi:DinB family protein [Persicobacter psychrovividus]|uniref:DinB superfamily protein n=1 Tax=Persicobacter psychrovividus TaxID=387638 RepID=A0ABM7VKX4_9BACT|nr:hypothetical protein PEPS_39050 [Persicobacter psychrovividus]